MSRVYFLFAFFALSSGSALAQSCLERSSNQELVQELSRRLQAGGGNSGGRGQVDVSALCRGPYLSLMTVNTATGMTTNSNEFSTNSDSDCREYSNQINSAAGRLRNGGIVAICRGPYLSRITIVADGTQRYANEAGMNSDAECKATATRINTN